MNYGGSGIKQKKKLLNSAATKLGTKLGIFCIKLLLVMAIALMVGGSCLVFGSFQGIVESAPDISSISVTPEGYATKIFDASGNEIQTLSTTGTNRTYVTIDGISKDLQHAFIAIEDERFYEHNGIDLKGILRAASLVLSSGKLSQGGSTITQQLLKNNVFNAYNESTLEKIRRKVQEQYLAVKLETIMEKDFILESYLNTINLGNGYYGVQAAANGYFNKDVSELTISECAVIASITKSPTGLNPIRNPERNKGRMQQVLKNMLEQGYITKEQYDEAYNDDVYSRLEGVELAGTANSTYSYFIDETIEQLIKDLMQQKGYTEAQATNLLYKGGLQVYTTQDIRMQEIADEVINNPDNYVRNTDFTINYSLTVKEADGTYSYYGHNSMLIWYKNTVGDSNFSLTQNDTEQAEAYVAQYRDSVVGEGASVYSESLTYTIQPQVSFSIIEQSTGYVKVMVGGRGDKTLNRSMNRATDDVTRQPGSSIKPLAVYGPALDIGAISLASTTYDAPYYYTGTDAKLIKNYYEGEYRGYMSTREAITLSQNVPAVKILNQITPQVGFSYLQNFGLSTLVAPKDALNGNHDVVQSLALGGLTKGVCNIDMSAAYAAIANKGVYTTPVYYTKVLDSEGNVIIDNSNPETHRVLKETTAWLLTSALESVVTNGTGRVAQVTNQTTVGKTGTTQFDSDIWFCGFTPYYTAAIWVGYDDNSKTVSKVVNHTKLWGLIMEQIHQEQNLPAKTFDKPTGITEVEVCKRSGLLPVEGLCDGETITEYFATENVPTEKCNVHVQFKMCNETNMVASSKCTDVSTQIKLKISAANVLGEDKEGSEYKTWDADLCVTDEYLGKICTKHSSSPGSGATTPVTATTQSATKATGTATATTASTNSSTTATTVATTSNNVAAPTRP